jgi:pimeloyl-ACP methyl ester carboxylesterase
MLDVLEKEMDNIFLNDDLTFNFEAITDQIIRRFFEDLDAYYTKTMKDNRKNERPVKELIREELARVLQRHRHKRILLIAHSMGSIIAYDVLSQGIPDIEVDTLVTIGSPLGIPIIIRKIHAERHDRSLEIKPRTPESITRTWYNFSDLDDKVVLDYTLADDYRKNSKGIQAVDQVVFNDYEIDGERNPHNSYGYLRTPEMSDVLDHFLSER